MRVFALKGIIFHFDRLQCCFFLIQNKYNKKVITLARGHNVTLMNPHKTSALIDRAVLLESVSEAAVSRTCSKSFKPLHKEKAHSPTEDHAAQCLLPPSGSSGPITRAQQQQQQPVSAKQKKTNEKHNTLLSRPQQGNLGKKIVT